MNCISNIIFSPWLDQTEGETVGKHIWKNFTYVRYKHTETEKEYFGRLNKVTREVLWADQSPLISFKCLLIITLAVPLDFIIRETFYTTRLLITCTQIFFKSIFYFLYNLRNGAPIVAFHDHILKGLAVCLHKTIVKEVKNIARIAFYCIGIALAATGGLCVDPLKARRRIGFMTIKLNQGVSNVEYMRMLRMQAEKNPEFNQLKCLESFYLAPCMQPWVLNIEDHKWKIVVQDNDYDKVSINGAKEYPCAKWAIFPLIPFCF